MTVLIDYRHRVRVREKIPALARWGIAIFAILVLLGYAEQGRWFSTPRVAVMSNGITADAVFQCSKSRQGNWRWLPGRPDQKVEVDPDGICPENGLILAGELPREEVWYYRGRIDAKASKKSRVVGEVARLAR